MSQITLTLRGYRQDMVISTIFSASVVITASLFLAKKLTQASSHWLTLIASLLILAEISSCLCSVFYYTQFNLLFSNFPVPPSTQDVTEAQRLLTSFDVFTEIYYAAFTSMFLILAGLLWQTSSRIEQIHKAGL